MKEFFAASLHLGKLHANHKTRFRCDRRGLNPEYVTGVAWWEHDSFVEKDSLEAAELVAFEVLEPALRSRGGVTERAKALHRKPEFFEEMAGLLNGEPTGLLTIRTMQQAWDKIDELESKIAVLEERLGEGV